jgi:hypothetical protein
METADFSDVNGVIAALAIDLKTVPVEAASDQTWNQAARVRESTEQCGTRLKTKHEFTVPLDPVLQMNENQRIMATQDLDQERIGELRGFLQGYAKLHQALTISRYEHDVIVLPVEGSVEETLQGYFDSLGKKLKPPVKHWEMRLEELKPWEQPAEELFSHWLLADDDLRGFYRSRRENDPRPGELHVGTNDIARAFREQLEAVLGRGKKRVWDVSVHALVGATDRYLATLDNHLAIDLGDGVLLVSFTMNR